MPRTTPGGQARYSQTAIETALMVRLVFQQPLRQTERLLSSLGPVTLVIDSTGLKVYGAGEWHRDKHGLRDRPTIETSLRSTTP